MCPKYDWFCSAAYILKVKIQYVLFTLTLTSSTKFPDTSLLSSCSSSVAAWALFCKISTTSFSIYITLGLDRVVMDKQFCVYLPNTAAGEKKAAEKIKAWPESEAFSILCNLINVSTHHTITKNLFKIVTKSRQWLAGQWLYLFPTSSPDTLCPSTTVKAPIPKKQSKNNVNTIIYMNSWLRVMIWGAHWEILIPGSTRFLRISEPVAVALMRHTWAFSSASCPWSPHNLIQTYNNQ